MDRNSLLGREDNKRSGRSCWLCWGKAGGKGRLFPGDKLQKETEQKTPWAEPWTEKGGRDSRKEVQSKGERVSH